MAKILIGKVLFVGAHPDDIEIGCGGTAAKGVALGHKIAFALATDEKNPRRAKRRQDEARKAASILGLSEGAGTLFFGHLPDTMLQQQHPELRNWLAQVRTQFNPDTVFTHRLDDHSDHRAVHEVSKGVFRGKNVVFYPITRSQPDVAFDPNHGEDISAYIARKVAMCRCHASQGSRNYVDADRVETYAHQVYRDWFKKRKKRGYAESFIIHESHSPLDKVGKAGGRALSYNVRVIRKRDGTVEWED